MPVKIPYTSKMNVAEYSDAIDTVAYDSVADMLHVIWHNNQRKVYSYYALPSSFTKIVDNVETCNSVRALVREVTDSLQRAYVTDNAELSKREVGITVPAVSPSDKVEFKVTVQIDGTYVVSVQAHDLVGAANKVNELFQQNLVDGAAVVTEVKKA